MAKTEKQKPPHKLAAEPWYQLEGDEAAAKAFDTVQRLHSQQYGDRVQLARDLLALYEGNAARELGLLSALAWGLDPATFNVIGSVVDTRASHVLKNKVRPYFLTDKGNWNDRRKAMGMQRAVEGTFHAAGIYGELGQHICWDGEIFEAGCVKVVPDYANSRVLIERMQATDIFFDHRDAKLGKPTCCHVVQTIDRAKLLDFCKDSSDDVIQAIVDAPPAPIDMYKDDEPEVGDDTTSDRVAVCELWHLPSGRVDRKSGEAWEVDKTHDGRHMIVLWGAKDSSQTLVDEAWPFDYFPIAFYRPKKRRRGFWSESVAERNVGAQLAINRQLARVDGVLDLHAVPRLGVNRQAKVNTDKISNDWAAIIQGNGPPGQWMQYIPPPSLGAEFYHQIDRLIRYVFDREGVSELSSTARKPAGIESGVALQTLQDTESIRHTDVFRAWEDFHVALAKMVVDAFRMLSENGCTVEVMFGDDKDLQKISWNDVDLDEDRYKLMVWPTNLLPQTPAAKLDRVLTLVQAGFIKPEHALMLLDFPDLSMVVGDQNAAADNITRQIERIVDGEIVTPHPYLALELAHQTGIDRINRLEADGAPEDVLDRLRQYVEDIQEHINRARPPAPPVPVEQPTGMAAPLPMPEPAPQQPMM